MRRSNSLPPSGSNEFLGIPYRLAEGLQIHFFFMWLFAINGLIYVIYASYRRMASDLPVPSSLKRAAIVALNDAHIAKAKPHRQIQRRSAYRLHDDHRDGSRLDSHGTFDLQTAADSLG